jgi:hypothetical protein
MADKKIAGQIQSLASKLVKSERKTAARGRARASKRRAKKRSG